MIRCESGHVFTRNPSHASSTFVATRPGQVCHKTLSLHRTSPSQTRGTPPPLLGRSSLPRLSTMGIVVLVLRCYLVFQNVFITFKTLKLPPPSSRNNGQPSIRALTQRKRDMKGCMAIWIIWVSRVTLRAPDIVMKLFTQVLPGAL
jgi:hypothetical protein